MTERAPLPPAPRSTSALSLAVLIAMVAALSSFVAVLEGGWWGTATVIVALAAIGAAAVVRAVVRRWRSLWSILAAVVAALLSLTLLFAADTALLGVVPLFGTAERFAELIAAGELSIAEQKAPAVADDGIRFLLASGIGVLAIIADAMATLGRRPAFVALPLLAVLAVPVALAPGELPLLSLLATAAAYLLLLALHRPAASGGAAGVRRAVTVAAGVMVTALVVPPLLPPVSAGSSLPGSGAARLVAGINPVIELGDDLRRENPVTALRYTSEMRGGLYLTLAHLADFEAQTVQPVREGETTADKRIGPPSWLNEEVAVTAVTTRIQLEGLRTRWVPLPAAPLVVDGLIGDWVVDRDGVTMSTVEGAMREGGYTVESLVAAPTPEQLRAAGVSSEGFDRYLALPEAMDASIASTAGLVTAPSGTPYERALALQRFFTGGDFLYSELAPVEGGYDGSGADIVARFLEARAGYCVHFASAMTLMARTLGIPARIAVGFLPGRVDVAVPNQYIVGTEELHAWPELHFDGVGWVRFEPTPSRGSVPDYATLEALAPDEQLIDPETGELAPSPSAAPSGPSAPPPSPAPLDPGELIGGGGDPGESSGGTTESVRSGVDARPLAAALFALLAVLLLTPALWRALRRARRRRAPDPLRRWREVRDTARDLGLPAAETRTPRQLAAAWTTGAAARPRGAAPARAVEDPRLRRGIEQLESLRLALEARAYAGPSTGAVAAPPIDAVLGTLRRSARWWWRLLAVVLPISLFERLAGEPVRLEPLRPPG